MIHYFCYGPTLFCSLHAEKHSMCHVCSLSKHSVVYLRKDTTIISSQLTATIGDSKGGNWYFVVAKISGACQDEQDNTVDMGVWWLYSSWVVEQGTIFFSTWSQCPWYCFWLFKCHSLRNLQCSKLVAVSLQSTAENSQKTSKKTIVKLDTVG